MPRNFNYGPEDSAPTVRNFIAQCHSLVPHEHDNVVKLGDEMRHTYVDDTSLKGEENTQKYGILDTEK